MKNLLLILFACFTFFTLEGQIEETGSDQISFALIEASRLKMLGNFEESIRLYKLALSYDPQCAAALYELGALYSNTDQLTEAQDFISKAYNIDKNNIWYLIGYADLLSLNNYHRKAHKILQNGIRSFGKEEVNLRIRMADNFQRAGKQRKALKELSKLENNYGFSESIALNRIELLENLGKEKKVRNAYKKILEHDPGSIHSMLMFAEFLIEQEDYDEAISIYNDILEIEPENIFAISNLADLYGKMGDLERSYQFLDLALNSEHFTIQKKIQTLAFLLNDEERIKRDQSEISQIILNLINNNDESYELLILAYDFFFKLGDYQKSFDIIQQLVNIRDDNYIFWIQALYNGNLVAEYEEIIDLGTRALRIFPNKDDLRVFMAMAYYQTSRYNETQDILEETNNRFTEPGLKFQKSVLMAESKYKNGYTSEAFELFENLLLIEPDNINIKNNYSYYMALEETNLERAKTLSKETLEAEPDNPTFLDTYGWILYKSGDYVNAEYFIRKAYDLDKTNNREIFDHLIEILIFNEKAEEAETMKRMRDDE